MCMCVSLSPSHTHTMWGKLSQELEWPHTQSLWALDNDDFSCFKINKQHCREQRRWKKWVYSPLSTFSAKTRSLNTERHCRQIRGEALTAAKSQDVASHTLRGCSESGSGGALLRPVRLLAKPRTAAHQAPLSTGLSRQESRSGTQVTRHPPGSAPPLGRRTFRCRPPPSAGGSLQGWGLAEGWDYLWVGQTR